MSIHSYRSQHQITYSYIKELRLNRLVVGALIVLTFILAMRYALVVNQVPEEPLMYQPTVVQSGDSLWDLAANSGLDQDTRDLVFQIMQYNSLADTTIVPGQVIYIPVSSTSFANEMP